MSIKYALLGILSWKAATGYELKKLMEESSFMYWSGNNNQIYKALIQMQEEELVTSEVIHQDNAPTKKIYSITKNGLVELKEWLIMTPEAPEIKKVFLVQLAWSEILSDQEINELCFSYGKVIRNQLLMEQEKLRRGLLAPNRNPRENLIWEMISENLIASYKSELQWIEKFRQRLFENKEVEEKAKMNYQINEIENKKYIEVISLTNQLSKEDDVLDLISLCWEHETYHLMLHYDILSEDFFKLRTKLAGNVIQKLINYNIKTVALIPEEAIGKGRFNEMAMETNKGSHFRIYEDKDEAEQWLLK
jgi:DNA-binding PadR family transcriptional regulator